LKVVLVHSALGDSRLWKRQIAALEGEHELVAPDLPGWGETPLPREPFSFVDVVAEHLPAALVGNSFGGAIALRTALAHPDLVSRLVLIGSGLPAWDWTEEMREYFSAEEAAYEAMELQTAHEEPELIGPELTPFSSLGMPTLVIVGADDKPDFRAIAQHLAEEIPGAELAVVAGAGHLVGLDRPDELNALLHDFLQD
jgi:3-oxoadipate enol-lactonase